MMFKGSTYMPQVPSHLPLHKSWTLLVTNSGREALNCMFHSCMYLAFHFVTFAYLRKSNLICIGVNTKSTWQVLGSAKCTSASDMLGRAL